jgi:NOL1/NOP2/sun family putative RNA methylase
VLAKKYGYLPYMIERYIKFLGLEDTIKLLEANEKPLNTSIRVNTLKINVDSLREKLENKEFELKPTKWIPYGFEVFKKSYNLGSLHEYLQGYYYIQNVASMLPPLILDPNSDEVIIDMCAAPGSKATQLAQIMNNKGKLILIEKYPKRIPALEMNLRRMGVINSIVINMDAINISKLNIKANKILLDAPCTGEGLVREDKSRKKSRKLEDIKKLAIIQEKLLEAGLKALKSGGKLLYSTCSIAPEENEMVVNNVLEKNSNFTTIKISTQYGVNGYNKIYGEILSNDLCYSQRIYPYIHDTIGFYLCLIEKIS